MNILRLVCAFFVFISVAVDARAYWELGGNLVNSGTYGDIGRPGVASDGQGGVVVVWSEGEAVIAQRIDSGGNVVSGWSAITVGTAEDPFEESPEIIRHGSNWFVAWVDPHYAAGGPDFVVRVAKLDGDGDVVASASISDATASTAEQLTMATRSGGGVTVGWINGDDGEVKLFESDLSLENEGSIGDIVSVDFIRFVDDEEDGAIIVWRGNLDGTVRALRIDSDAETLWGDITAIGLFGGGVAQRFSVCADGQGGAVLAAEWYYSGSTKLYVQHMDADGSLSWNEAGWSTGKRICTSCASADASLVLLNSDEDEAVFSWGIGTDIYAQKVPLSGAFELLWGSTGKQVNQGDYSYTDFPVAASNLSGATTFVWASWGAGGSPLEAMNFQMIDDDGDAFWSVDGVVATNQSGIDTPVLACEQALGAYAAWPVHDGESTDLRLARVVPIVAVEYEFNLVHCRNNVSWQTPSGGTANKIDYRRIEAANWTAKNASGSAGSYTCSFPQTLPSEFKISTTVGGVVYTSVIYRDYGSCGEPDPEGAPRSGERIAEAYLNAHPNPFNPEVTIGYGVPGNLPVELAIFDLSGRRVKTLESGSKPNGAYVATWHGDDDRGQGVASGVYFSRLTVGGKTLTHKLVMLK